ncbi:hypothetical protein B0H16DRAFT_1732993 [Mycena metata]|uniref:BTB domain-containing protein n=1 Tax=Mycena metata TaxID=1033252 RepID=A0AAD7MTF1_9AGAR|nr:hypothetical protein B0H16DRAFT_1732993 [Mycena metata]
MSTNTSSTERDGPVENIGQFVQHSVYWYEDGSVVVRVDDTTIYKIHVTMLKTLLNVIGDILTIPDGKEKNDPTREGTLRFPLWRPGTDASEFEDFLRWLYRAAWEGFGHNLEERHRIFTHLFKLADMWQIKAARAYATDSLEALPLAASRRLQLAGQFTIVSWVEPAVKHIVERKLSALTLEDIAALGLRVYSTLVKAQELIKIETRRTALVSPQMPNDSSWQCQKHLSCISAWPKIWFERIGKRLLHPEKPIHLRDVKIEALSIRNSTLSERCALDMLDVIDTITFSHETIISAAACGVIKYYESL